MKLKEENADNLLSILQNEYSIIFDQKSRLESKAIGYITIESLLLSFALGLLTVYFTQTNFILNLFSNIILLTFIGVMYFGLVEIIASVKALSPRLLQFIDDCDMAKKSLNETEDDYKGSIVKSLLIVNRDNKKVIEEISFYNDFAYLFLAIDVGFVVFFIFLFCIGIL